MPRGVYDRSKTKKTDSAPVVNKAKRTWKKKTGEAVASGISGANIGSNSVRTLSDLTSYIMGLNQLATTVTPDLRGQVQSEIKESFAILRAQRQSMYPNIETTSAVEANGSIPAAPQAVPFTPPTYAPQSA
jgi:hypothetical protein